MQRRLRLRRAADFARLRNDGRAFPHSLLLLSVLPNELTYNRYGFITSKRLGGAVQRNSVRRRLREVIRALHPRLRAGYDVVLIARQGCVGASFHRLEQAVETACAQASLLLGQGGTI